MKKAKATYRIVNKNGTILNAGTDLSSWFFLEEARKIVDYKKGQKIYESNGVDFLWEAF